MNFKPFDGELDAEPKFAPFDGALDDEPAEDLSKPYIGFKPPMTKAAQGVGEAVVGEGERLRDAVFSGVDNVRAGVDTLAFGQRANRTQKLQSRLADLEARGQGDSLTAKSLRREIQGVQQDLPRAAEWAASAQEDAKRGSAMTSTPAMQEMAQAKSFGEAWEAFKKAPYDVISTITAQSMPAVLPALVTAAVAGPAPGALAMGASSGVTEAGSSLGKFASDAGVDVTDPKALQAFFSDPENLSQAMAFAGKRAGIIATADAVSGGVAGKIIAPAMRSGVARQAVNVPAQMGVQAGLGAGGEAGAQLATEGKISAPGEVLMEAVGELGGAPMEVATFGREARKAEQQITDPIAAIAPAQTVDEAIVAAAQALDAQPVAEQAVENIERILGATNVSTPPAIPGVDSGSAGGGVDLATPSVAAGVGNDGGAVPAVDARGPAAELPAADIPQPAGPDLDALRTENAALRSQAIQALESQQVAAAPAGPVPVARGDEPAAQLPSAGPAALETGGVAAPPPGLGKPAPALASPASMPAETRASAPPAAPSARQVALDAERAKLDAQRVKRSAAAREAAKPMEGLSVGSMPTNAEPVSVKDGVVYIGKYPAQNFDTGADVTVPAGATPQQIAEALKTSGALGKRAKFFGLPANESPAQATQTPEPTLASPEQQRADFAAAEKARTAPGNRARSRAQDANPFKAFIAKHGISAALAAEFAPGRRERQAAMVQGYGPVFRKSGLQLDALAELAVQDGYLTSPDVTRLSAMIGEALRGKRIIPQYAEGAAEVEMEARAALEKEAGEEQNAEVEAEAQAEREAIQALAELSDDNALLEDGVVIAGGNNTSVGDFLRAMGATEEEIANETAGQDQGQGRASQDGQGPGRAQETSPAQAPAAAGSGADPARADGEGLTAPTRADIEAQQDRAASAEALDQREQVRRESEAGAGLFSLTQEDGRQDTTGDLFGTPTAETDKAQESVDDLRKQLRDLEDRMVGAAGLAPGFIEEAVRSRKVSADMKTRREELRQRIRDMQGQVDSARAAPTPKEVDAKTDQIMRLFDEMGGGIALTREQVRALIVEKGMDAAEKSVQAFREKIQQDKATQEKLAKMKPATEKPVSQMSAADLLRAAADKMEGKAETIQDLGEKIGGARKDTAMPTGRAPRRGADTDDRPTWAKRFQISEIVRAGGQIGDVRDEGRWVIRDTRSLDWMKQPKQVGRDTYASKEAAEKVLPLLAVAQKHRVVPVNVARPKTEADVDAQLKADMAAKAEDDNRPGKMEAMVMQGAQRKLDAGEITQAQFDTVAEKYAEAAAKYTPPAARPQSAEPTQAWEIWRDVSDRKRVKVVDRQFASRDDAMRYMAENAEAIIEANTTFGEADLPVPEDKRREGPQRREGDVKGQDFMQAFGFRGVEFGNWNNQDERQELMNEAYDGLMDLAEVMGIPPKAISLNGDLALAFGARGHGLSGARAHYEPDRAVMNLTKMKGAGALAHEWFHALDHYFGRQDGKAPVQWVTNKDGTRSLKVNGDFENNAVSSGFSRTNSGVREEVRAAVAKVMTTMARKAEQYVEDTAKTERFVAAVRNDVDKQLASIRRDLAEQKDVRYYKRNNKPATADQLAEFDAIAQRILAGEALETELRSSGAKSLSGMRWTNDALEQISAIYKAVRGRSGFDSTDKNGILDRLRTYMSLYSQRLKMLAEAQTGTEKTKQVPTDFAMDARSLDQGRGTDYWTTPHEMAARAFQGYVEDKIAERGGKSPFLNYGPENVGILTPWGVKRPYPAGAERRAINAAFDQLVDVIQTRETDKGVAMFARGEGQLPAVINPSTVANVRAAITELLGGKQLAGGLGRIVATTSAEIKSTWEPLIGKNVQIGSEGEAGVAQAFYEPGTKTIFMIADHINVGAEAAVLAHELMHKHGQAVLGKAGWDRLHGMIGTWKDATEDSDERFVYDYATRKVQAVGEELSTQELFPYAVEAAIRMGIKPSLQAKRGTVASWLESVRQSLKTVWGKITGKPDTFRAQDLVDLAFGIAQMENPENAALQGVLAEQIDTPAFRKWFGDSKVVDAQGKPLVVYHGTAQDFEAFDNAKTGANDRGLWGRGHYFSATTTGPNSYSLRQGDGARIIPAYVALQNPLVLRTGDDLVTRLPDGTNTRDLIGQNLDGAKIKAIALDGGHDGVMQIKPDGTIGDVVAFRPEQIKSATGNRGTFDPDNADIRFSRATTAGTSPAERRPNILQRGLGYTSVDAGGRAQFTAGAWLNDKLGQAAGPMLAKLGLKAASPELRRMLRQMKLEIEQAKETAAAVAGEATKLSDAERAMVSDLVEKELQAGTVPPAHAVRLAAVINDAMGKQTDELIRLGMLNRETADKWRGQYLPRFYESKLGKTIKDVWADSIGKMFRAPGVMKGIKGKHLKGRGLYQTIPEDQLADFEALGWEVRDPDYQPGLTGDGTVQVWRDFTRQERDNMGEIRDAGFRFVMGYMQTQKDIALGRLFEALASNPEMSSRTETEAFSAQVPETKVSGTGALVYGKMSGRWVSPETLSQLSRAEEEGNHALQVYRKAMSLWKEAKTVLNPVAHANNIISNVTMAHFAGVSYWRPDAYMGAIRDLASKDPMVKEAKDAGLFLGTMSDAELMQNMPEELRVLAQKQEGTAEKVGRNVWDLMSFWLRKPMGAAYQAEDTFFRYLLYRDARQRGIEPQDAVDYAQKYIFTYDDLPKGARRIRDFGLPFFAYTYKAVPALLNTALAHPERMAAPAVVLMMANTVAYAIAAGDEDDWQTTLKRYLNDADFRQNVREKEKFERALLPEWNKGYTALMTPKVIRLGNDELTNLPLFLDMSRMMPGGDLFDVNPNAGGIPLPQPITPNHPIFTLFTGLIANKDLFRGTDLTDSNDTSAEKTEKRADWIWKQLSPAIALNNYHWERTMNALAQLSDGEVKYVPDVLGGDSTGIGKDGLPVQPKYAAAQTFGIKVRPIDLETSELIQLNQQQKMVRDIDAEIRRLKRWSGIGAINDRTLEKELDAAIEKKMRLREGLTVDGEERN